MSRRVQTVKHSDQGLRFILYSTLICLSVVSDVLTLSVALLAPRSFVPTEDANVKTASKIYFHLKKQQNRI